MSENTLIRRGAGTASVVLGAGPVCLMPGLSAKLQDPGWGAPRSVFSELSVQLMESAPQDQVYFWAVCVCLCPGCRSCSLPPAPSLLRTDPAVLSGKEAARLAGCYVISLLQRKEDFLQPIFSKGLGTMKFCHGSVIWISV